VASTDRDLPLKLRATAIFRRMGYIAFNEVDLCTYTYGKAYRRKQITDFDVLGVRIEPDLERSLAVAECKSAEDRAMEHLLKLNGVRDFFGARKAYFVQQRIDENAREVGSQLGIVCLDSVNLGTLMCGLDVRDEREVASEESVYRARANLLRTQKEQFPRQTEYLKYDFWTLPDHRNVINLMRLMNQMAKTVDARNLAHVILCHQLVTALALSVLSIGGAIIRQNIDDLKESLLTNLLGGSRERRDREVLHDTVSRLVGNDSLPLKPPFFEPLVELVHRYIAALSHSHRVVACLDEMCRKLLRPEDAVVGDIQFEHFSDRTIKLARDACHFSILVGGLPKDAFLRSLVDEPVKDVEKKLS
jgi:hypothetical protein